MRVTKNIISGLILFALIFSCSRQDDELLNNANIAKLSQPNIGLKSAAVNGPEISQVVPDRYIVVFKSSVSNPGAEASQLKARYGLEPGHIYDHAIVGFSAYIPGNAVDGLRNNPNIAYIEPDITMEAFGQVIPTGVSRVDATANSTAAIDGNGGNVAADVAIVDTGVDTNHPDLYVVGGKHFYTITTGRPQDRGSFSDDNYDDDNGHGTHVAGTVAALDNGIGVVGVAPGANIWAVKVLNSQGSGYLSDIIAGLDWVVSNGNIEVVNMSLGGQGKSDAFRTAVQSCVNAGIVVVVAAGNSSMDVYGPDGKFDTNDDFIPAAYPEAATISALADADGQPGGLGGSTSYGPDDSFASFSNFSNSVVSDNPVNSPGKAIDLMCPGVDILSTYYNGQYATMSGTSMATPHATGLAALYVAANGRAHDAAGVYAIRQALIDAGMPQQSTNGLADLNDPDNNEENLGWAGPSDVTIQLIANAGPDQTITAANNVDLVPVTLDGSGSTPAASITSYVWSEGESEITSGETASVNLAIGKHTITLTVSDGTNTASDVVVITINAPGSGLSIASISPNSVSIGSTTDITVTGTGFVSGTSLTFENGSGAAPEISNLQFVDGTTITATMTIKNSGPFRTRTWDVRVTNPDSETAVLQNGLTIQP